MNGSTPEQNQNTQQPQNPPANQASANPDPDSIKSAVLQEIFGGKFKSVEDAKNGYWQLNNYASEAYQALQSRVNPVVQQAAPDPFEALAQEGLVKPDVIRAAIRNEASKLLKEELAPVTSALVARAEIEDKLPEYIQNEAAIMGWLRTNQEVAQDVKALQNAGQHVMAAKAALREWKVANPPANPGNMQHKQQAALPNGQVANPNGPAPVGNTESQEDLFMKAVQYGHMTGDKRAAYSMVFPNFKVTLPPHLADQFPQR